MKKGLSQLIVLLVLFQSLSCEKNTNQPEFKLDPPDPVSVDIYEIYSSLLDAYYPGFQDIITPQQTDSTQDGSIAFYLQLDSLGIDSVLIAQALQVNKSSFFLDNKFTSKAKVHLVGREELQYWNSDFQGLFKHYNVSSIFNFGMPYIYSNQIPGNQMAFFSYYTYCGPLCAEWYFVVAEKTAGKWQIIFHFLTGIS